MKGKESREEMRALKEESNEETRALRIRERMKESM